MQILRLRYAQNATRVGSLILDATSVETESVQPKLPMEPERLPQQAVQKALAQLPGLDQCSKLEQPQALVEQAAWALHLAQVAQRVALALPERQGAERRASGGAPRPSAGGLASGASRSHRPARYRRSGRISREFQDDSGLGPGSCVFRRPFARG